MVRRRDDGHDVRAHVWREPLQSVLDRGRVAVGKLSLVFAVAYLQLCVDEPKDVWSHSVGVTDLVQRGALGAGPYLHGGLQASRGHVTLARGVFDAGHHPTQSAARHDGVGAQVRTEASL